MNREIMERLCLVRFFFGGIGESGLGAGMLHFTINKVNLSIKANQGTKLLGQGKC